MEFTLTKSQQTCFDFIENTNANTAVLGKPGVGKSVLIHALIKHGRKTYVIAAPTGLAALNVDGRTLHSIFRLPTSEGIIDPGYDRWPDERAISHIKYNIHALIVDECSMVRADAFDYIDRLMRYAKGKDLPFGGVQVVLIGDFFQLPPVVKTDERKQLRLANYLSEFLFDSHVFGSNFSVLQLDEVLRQKGDPDFIDLLHKARTGELRIADLKSLNKQVGHPEDLRINLVGTNRMAEDVNAFKLNKLPEPTVTFMGEKFGEWPALPAEERLNLRIGAQVMVKMNGADRPPKHKGEFFSEVVNGTLGVVRDIIPAISDHAAKELGNEGIQLTELQKVDRVIIDIDPESEGGHLVTIYRKQWERKIKERGSDGKWTERVIATYNQVPVALAWAISIHKSQGQTFEKVHIDATKIFAAGQLYVALSRCKSMAGISLQVPVNLNMFWANRDVMRFMGELETQTTP